MAGELYGFSGEDVSRIGGAIRDFERSPGSRPLHLGGHEKTSARVVAFEVINATPDADGLITIELLELDYSPITLLKRSPQYQVHLLRMNPS